MNYICENCGEEITREEYLKVSIWEDALCPICKKLSKKKRLERAFEMFKRREQK